MVRLAPLNVPLARRLQTAAVALIYFLQGIGLILTTLLLYWNIYTRTFMLAYILFIVYETKVTRVHERGMLLRSKALLIQLPV